MDIYATFGFVYNRLAPKNVKKRCITPWGYLRAFRVFPVSFITPLCFKNILTFWNSGKIVKNFRIRVNCQKFWNYSENAARFFWRKVFFGIWGNRGNSIFCLVYKQQLIVGNFFLDIIIQKWKNEILILENLLLFSDIKKWEYL